MRFTKIPEWLLRSIIGAASLIAAPSALYIIFSAISLLRGQGMLYAGLIIPIIAPLLIIGAVTGLLTTPKDVEKRQYTITYGTTAILTCALVLVGYYQLYIRQWDCGANGFGCAIASTGLIVIISILTLAGSAVGAHSSYKYIEEDRE